MPAVSERFTSYRKFAESSLEVIYGDKLKSAQKWSINSLASGIFINETEKGGPIKMRWIQLPWEAQLSPVNDIATGDFNQDGHVEIILAQNHSSNWLETGPWRGSPGTHLEWRDNTLHLVPHHQSGLLLENDTKAIQSIRLNADGSPDLITASNNSPLKAFLSDSKKR